MRTDGYQKHKSRMLSIARRRLSVSGKKQKVFEACAAHLGTAWDGTKAGGYELVFRVVAKHRGTPLLPVVPKALKKAPVGAVATKDFLETYEWRRLRMDVLVKRGARCECCGATPKDGVRMHVDHIKPRKLFPALALDEANLQILCEVCNHGKGNWDQTDWRQETADPMRPRLVKRA